MTDGSVNDETRKMTTAKRLEPRDWERAALDAIATDGIVNLAIPKLARSLGVTKGSFYWHFKGLDRLLKASLDRWERTYTDQRIERFEQQSSTLKARLQLWSVEAESHHKAQALYLEISGAAVTRPAFAATVERVVEKRTAFIARTYRDLGFSAVAARRRAVIAYASYVGMLHLAQVAPKTVGGTKERSATVRVAMKLIASR